MKIRSGFVSNSSSSSYIVVFKSLPASKEELRKMMFGNQKLYHGPYHGEWDTNVVAETVWDYMQKSVPNDLPDLKNGFDSWEAYQHIPHPNKTYPNLYNSMMPEADRTRILNEYYEAIEALQMELFRKFMDENKGSFVYRFEFSDNDGAYYTDLEHGDLFKRLPHIKCSHH
jgi:hypothetical protein